MGNQWRTRSESSSSSSGPDSSSSSSSSTIPSSPGLPSCKYNCLCCLLRKLLPPKRNYTGNNTGARRTTSGSYSYLMLKRHQMLELGLSQNEATSSSYPFFKCTVATLAKVWRHGMKCISGHTNTPLADISP